MAEVLKDFDFQTRGTNLAPFADGRIWKVTIGVDVKCKDEKNLRDRAWHYATKIGKKVRVAKLPEPGAFAIQFYDSNGEAGA